MPELHITYREEKDIDEQLLFVLYNDAGWEAYTKDIKALKSAIQNSLFVLTAWHNEKLIALIRIIGDGITIVYIQDILVRKAYQRKGIGAKLLNEVLKKFSSVRQKVLLTEDTIEARKFYEASGFVSCDKGELVAFAKLNK